MKNIGRTATVSFLFGIFGTIVGIAGVTLAIIFGTTSHNCNYGQHFKCNTQLYPMRFEYNKAWNSAYNNTKSPQFKDLSNEISNNIKNLMENSNKMSLSRIDRLTPSDNQKYTVYISGFTQAPNNKVEAYGVISVSSVDDKLPNSADIRKKLDQDKMINQTDLRNDPTIVCPKEVFTTTVSPSTSQTSPSTDGSTISPCTTIGFSSSSIGHETTMSKASTLTLPTSSPEGTTESNTPPTTSSVLISTTTAESQTTSETSTATSQITTSVASTSTNGEFSTMESTTFTTEETTTNAGSTISDSTISTQQSSESTTNTQSMSTMSDSTISSTSVSSTGSTMESLSTTTAESQTTSETNTATSQITTSVASTTTNGEFSTMESTTFTTVETTTNAGSTVSDSTISTQQPSESTTNTQSMSTMSASTISSTIAPSTGSTEGSTTNSEITTSSISSTQSLPSTSFSTDATTSKQDTTTEGTTQTSTLSPTDSTATSSVSTMETVTTTATDLTTTTQKCIGKEIYSGNLFVLFELTQNSDNNLVQFVRDQLITKDYELNYKDSNNEEGTILRLMPYPDTSQYSQVNNIITSTDNLKSIIDYYTETRTTDDDPNIKNGLEYILKNFIKRELFSTVMIVAESDTMVKYALDSAQKLKDKGYKVIVIGFNTDSNNFKQLSDQIYYTNTTNEYNTAMKVSGDLIKMNHICDTKDVTIQSSTNRITTSTIGSSQTPTESSPHTISEKTTNSQSSTSTVTVSTTDNNPTTYTTTDYQQTTEEPCDSFSGTVSYAYEMTNDAPVSAQLMKDHLFNLDIFDYDQTIAVNVPFPDTFSYDILLYNTTRSKAELVGNLEDQVISYGLTKSPSIVESLDYILKKNVNGKHVIILIANSSTEVDVNKAKADADQLRAKEDTYILTVSFNGTDLSSLGTNGFNLTVHSSDPQSLENVSKSVRHLLCHL